MYVMYDRTLFGIEVKTQYSDRFLKSLDKIKTADVSGPYTIPNKSNNSIFIFFGISGEFKEAFDYGSSMYSVVKGLMNEMDTNLTYDERSMEWYVSSPAKSISVFYRNETGRELPSNLSRRDIEKLEKLAVEDFIKEKNLFPTGSVLA